MISLVLMRVGSLASVGPHQIGILYAGLFRAAEAGVDLPPLTLLLSHWSTRCLHRYVHPMAEHKRAAMRRFDRKVREAEK